MITTTIGERINKPGNNAKSILSEYKTTVEIRSGNIILKHTRVAPKAFNENDLRSFWIRVTVGDRILLCQLYIISKVCGLYQWKHGPSCRISHGDPLNRKSYLNWTPDIRNTKVARGRACSGLSPATLRGPTILDDKRILFIGAIWNSRGTTATDSLGYYGFPRPCELPVNPYTCVPPFRSNKFRVTRSAFECRWGDVNRRGEVYSSYEINWRLEDTAWLLILI